MLFPPESELSLNIPLADPRMMQPDLLIPGRKPAGLVEADINLINRNGVVWYFPLLQNDKLNGTGNRLVNITENRSVTRETDFDTVGNSFNSTLGFESTGIDGDCALSHDEGAYNQAIDGAHRVIASLGVTWKSISATDGENVILKLLIETNNGLYLSINASGNLIAGSRSQVADSFKSHTTTFAPVAGTKYDIEILISYAADSAVIKVNGQQIFSDPSVGYGSTTYSPGNPITQDGLLGSDAAEFSDAILHYFIVQKDWITDGNHSGWPLSLDPYALLKPPGPTLITNAKAANTGYHLPDVRLEMPGLFLPKQLPAGPLAIDWSHPVTKDLNFAFVWEGYNPRHDLVEGWPPLKNDMQSNLNGLECTGTTDAYQFQFNSVARGGDHWQDGVVIMSYRQIGTSDAFARLIDSNSNFGVYRDNNSTSSIIFFITGTNIEMTGNANIWDGDEWIIKIEWSASLDFRAITCIKPDGTGYTYSSDTTAHATDNFGSEMTILNDNNFDRPTEGECRFCYIWNKRNLPWNDIDLVGDKGFAADPYQFIIPAA